MEILALIIGTSVFAAIIWRGSAMTNILDDWIIKDEDHNEKEK